MRSDKRTLSCLTALMVALSLCMVSVPAYAAKKAAVYVVTQVKSSDGSEKYTYSYDKNGLVKKETNSGGSITYSYKNGNISKMVDKSLYYPTKTRTYTYKKGKLVKAVEKDMGLTTTTTYTLDKKGRIKKQTSKNGSDPDTTITYKYDKKGLVSRLTSVNTQDKTRLVWSFKYDKKKNMTAFGYTYGSNTMTATYKNSYKNGRLTKRVEIHPDKTRETYTYTYKKMKVPKSKVKKIKAQQPYLLRTQYSDDVH